MAAAAGGAAAAAEGTAEMVEVVDADQYVWTLVTIPFSPFNERARWALELAGVRYAAVHVLPLFNLPVVAWHHWRHGTRPGRSDRASSPLSTPLLLGRPALRSAPPTTHPVALTDSGDIVRLADRHAPQRGLYPPAHTDAIRALERRLHDELGPAGRVLDYYYLLPSWSLTARVMYGNVGPVQATLYMLLFPLLRLGLRRALRVDATQMHKAVATLDALFADVGALLATQAAAHGTDRPYLVGTAFSAADLTFAALAAPVLGINQRHGFGAWLPELEELPAPLRAAQERLRATPAGQHALRMYSDHRTPA
jgi:glutathione S-transferase